MTGLHAEARRKNRISAFSEEEVGIHILSAFYANSNGWWMFSH
jgi:hypothetical protein